MITVDFARPGRVLPRRSTRFYHHAIEFWVAKSYLSGLEHHRFFVHTTIIIYLPSKQRRAKKKKNETGKSCAGCLKSDEKDTAKFSYSS
jgi:hypothetical protein